MNLESILIRLYALEQHVLVRCFWDNGWSVSLGTGLATKTFRSNELNECVLWLEKKLKELES